MSEAHDTGSFRREVGRAPVISRHTSTGLDRSKLGQASGASRSTVDCRTELGICKEEEVEGRCWAKHVDCIFEKKKIKRIERGNYGRIVLKAVVAFGGQFMG